jgi:uncharacterized protein with NRDE domain
MCVLLVVHHQHARWNLIIAANRDEFHHRPTAPAAPWDDVPGLLAGRDLEAGGTWLGVNPSGRISAVTNLRGARASSRSHSRGHLVRDFLAPDAPEISDYLRTLDARASTYAGCNLLLSAQDALHWWSPRGAQALSPGIFGVSNAALDEPEWSKVARLRQGFREISHLDGAQLEHALLALLREEEAEADGAAGQRLLEDTIFVQGGGYGTRCSSLVMRGNDGRIVFLERRFDAAGLSVGESRYETNGFAGGWRIS